MDVEKLEQARMVFEDRLSFPRRGEHFGLFFPDALPEGNLSLEELCTSMLENTELVDRWLNWAVCSNVLNNIGLDISEDSFEAFAYRENFEGDEEVVPERVQELLEYLSSPNLVVSLEDFL